MIVDPDHTQTPLGELMVMMLDSFIEHTEFGGVPVNLQTWPAIVACVLRYEEYDEEDELDSSFWLKLWSKFEYKNLPVVSRIKGINVMIYHCINHANDIGQFIVQKIDKKSEKNYLIGMDSIGTNYHFLPSSNKVLKIYKLSDFVDCNTIRDGKGKAYSAVLIKWNCAQIFLHFKINKSSWMKHSSFFRRMKKKRLFIVELCDFDSRRIFARIV
jgi:hypothetical protein